MSKRQQVVEAVLEALEKAGVPLSEDAAASAGMAQTRQLDAISDKPTQTTADPAAGDKESGKVDLTGADAEGEKRTGGETAGTEAVSEDPNKVKTAVLIPAASNQGAAPAGAAKVAGGGPESVAVGGDPGIVADKDKDKSTKPAGQPIPEAEEEKAAKVEHEALGAVLEKIKAAESSYEGLLAKVDELKKVMTGDATMTEQERLEKMEKARKSVAGHVADIEKALGAHKSAHESLHKAHESLLDAHKAAHEAHKVAHEARLAHKGSHDAMHGKVAESLIGIKKVLGGGPESEFAVGGESFPDNPASIGGTNSGADAADATYAGKAITAADVAKIVKAAVAEALGKGKKVCTVCKEEHDGDGDKCAACKAKKETADKSFTAEDIRKEVANTLKAIFEGMVTPTVAGEVTKAAGVGDRAQAKPFTKSEDNGTGTAASLTSADVMSPEDWKAYSSGNKTAIKKAQHCTVFKWQPVPTRLLSRLSN